MSSEHWPRAGELTPHPGRTDQWNAFVWEIYRSQHQRRNHLQAFHKRLPAFRVCQSARRPDRKVLSIRAATENVKSKKLQIFLLLHDLEILQTTLKCLSVPFAAKNKVSDNLQPISIYQNTLKFFNKGQRNA